MLNKAFRITENKDFQSVFKNGRFVQNRAFLLKYNKNILPNSRFGFIVSVKTLKRAVDRNLIKRRFREIIRLNFDNIKEGYDVVFIIKKQALDIEYTELTREILNALNSAKLI